MASPELSDQELLTALTPVAETLYNRHLETSKPWYPHEFIPWSLGKDFDKDIAWDPNDFPLPDATRSALFVNLLTEDNLPYYFKTIDRMFGNSSVWRVWSHRWTAEENRHSIAIRDYMNVTRALDPIALEDARMLQMSKGEVPEPATAVDGFVYVALQELATRVAHRNTGQKLREHAPDHPAAEAGYEVMARVAADENFHYLFYRDATTAAIEIDPSSVVKAIERQVIDFEMPGTGIIDFDTLKGKIGEAGVFGANELVYKVFEPVLYRHWDINNLTGLSPEAERSLAGIEKYLKIIRRAAKFESEKREKYEEELKQTT